MSVCAGEEHDELLPAVSGHMTDRLIHGLEENIGHSGQTALAGQMTEGA